MMINKIISNQPNVSGLHIYRQKKRMHVENLLMNFFCSYKTSTGKKDLIKQSTIPTVGSKLEMCFQNDK